MKLTVVILLLPLLAAPTLAQEQFQSRGIDQLSRLTLTQMGVAAGGNGNDIWGHVSPSGREYAVVGCNNRAVFVEVTNPAAPVIVATIPHTNSLWAGLKVYNGFAYVVNESGGGMQVIDMRQIDAGTVTLTRTVTANGLTHAHTMALNPSSGYLYLAGSNATGSNGGLAAYSLADPSNPVLAGVWGVNYVHEAQVVSFTSGPYAGREIAYCCNEEVGLQIVDVTNKAAMSTVSTLTYPGLQYCHQGWLSEDRRYFYINDELDGPAQGVPNTLTRIADVSDITAPFLAGTFTSDANTSVDHNLYVNGRYIYASNYRSGLRVFDAINPTAPTEVAFLDTYPEDDSTGYDGTWTNYPFLPSGTLLINDINRGLFVARLNLNYLNISYVGGPVTQVPPNTPAPVIVSITNVGAALDPSTVTVHARIGAGAFTSTPMTSIGGGQFRGNLPPAPCESTVSYYVAAANTQGGTTTSPAGAPTFFHTATAVLGSNISLSYDMEAAAGWGRDAVGDTATIGLWERGDPEPTAAQPGDDHTPGPGVNCWVTGRLGGSLGSNDVDGGRTTLLSPVLNLASAPISTRIGYWRWYSNNQGAAPNADVFVIDLSNNAGSSWTTVETVGPSGAGTAGGWIYHEFRVTDVLPLTSTMRLRFVADDAASGSIIEAAVDDVTVFTPDCGPVCGTADFDGDGDVGTDADIEAFFACLAGTCCNTCGSADFNADGDTGTDADIEAFFRVLAGGSC